MKPKTAVVTDDIYLKHFTGDSHPESHHRLEVLYDMLQDEDMQGIFKELSPRPATQAELELNHSLDYINQVSGGRGPGWGGRSDGG
jgi:acetoin utilization deacetylase AcuC-like enzyme